jgi:hypothetical protein
VQRIVEELHGLLLKAGDSRQVYALRLRADQTKRHAGLASNIGTPWSRISLYATEISHLATLRVNPMPIGCGCCGRHVGQ